MIKTGVMNIVNMMHVELFVLILHFFVYKNKIDPSEKNLGGGLNFFLSTTLSAQQSGKV